jgi:cutinase
MMRSDWVEMDVLKLINKRARRVAATVGAGAVMAASGLTGTAAPSASADSCPDVDVVFARGSGEPPGLGDIGQQFVDGLRGRIGGRSLGVYPVNYQASDDFDNPDFPVSVIDGIRDAGSHIQSMAANCPQTREVLGGYSQGASVVGYVTSAAVLLGVPAAAVPKPMSPDIANHVAAVTLFAKPSDEFLGQYGCPPIVINPLYQPKTLELCTQGDPVCGGGNDAAAHGMYAANGMTGQAADFAASHL